VLEFVPSISTCTVVVRPRLMSRAKLGSTRTTRSTSPLSSSVANLASLAGVATTEKRRDPTKPASRSRLSSV
jgi:hypothetical protein